MLPCLFDIFAAMISLLRSFAACRRFSHAASA